MLTRKQRDRLEALSTELFGVASKWRKVLKDPGLQVVTAVEEVPVKYAHVRHKNGRFTAVSSQETLTEKKAVTREMTYDELEVAMTASLEMKQFAQLHAKNEVLLYETVARRYADDSLMNMPYLIVRAEERGDFDSLVADLPDAMKTEIAEYVVPNAHPKRFSMDGTKFVTELIYLMSAKQETNQPVVAPPTDTV